METFNSIQKDGKTLVSVRAYKGDAMTLLAFDVHESKLENLAGFTIQYSYQLNGKTRTDYMFNRLSFNQAFLTQNPQITDKEKNSTLYSPIQKFNWVHVPNTNINTQKPAFGEYTYKITPRYIHEGKLQALDNTLTVELKIDVSPYSIQGTQVAFTRGFISSLAYARRFNVKNNQVRPKEPNDSLTFDVKQIADYAERWDFVTQKNVRVAYTFEEQHQWLGWQARARILEFLDEALADTSIQLKVFAYDLNEPEISKRFLKLAAQNRLQIILDNAGKHGEDESMESEFERQFKQLPHNQTLIHRGNYSGLAHSKIFIQVRANQALKVLTGSTNFSTNGLYVNANHILIFNQAPIAQLYLELFEASFGDVKMDNFKKTDYAKKDFDFAEAGLPTMTITFAPHPKTDAQRIFNRISGRIKAAQSDVLFAIMQDTSGSSILDAVKAQVQSDTIFTYGVTDTISKNDREYSVSLYKPNSKKGIRVAAKGIENILPEPFGKIPKVDGYAIHHKFVVVDFKGENPVVYCGSSNLAFGPEQSNGDNLLEIKDKDIVTAFAIEALRLVDHYHWRNKELKALKEINLDDLSKPAQAWYKAWFNEADLRCLQRKLYIRE
jgi:phosphatidylserine/phosphatidylglycerophosphate/cardiolipin synthase-like enzyme